MYEDMYTQLKISGYYFALFPNRLCVARECNELTEEERGIASVAIALRRVPLS